MAAVLAIDVGGTRIKAAVVTGREVGAIRVAETPRTVDAALDSVAELAGDLMSGDVTSAGVCVPGLVDAGGRVLALPGKLDGIVGRDLPSELSQRLGVQRVVVVNDAVAFGAGEALVGAGAGYDRVVVMTIGTGIGTTVFDQGRPLGSGPLGAGILGGQMPLYAGDPRHRDTSDRTGTLEAACRAERIVDYAVEAGCTARTVAEVYAKHAEGCEAAQAGIAAYRELLALAVRALANAHGARAVVVGGGPVTGDDPLLDGVEDAVRRDLWPAHELDVRRAELGDAAALVGLAALTSPTA